MELAINELRETVEGLANEIGRGPLQDQVRCHEMARLLKPGIERRHGCSVIIRDGIAVYALDFLINLFQARISEKPDDLADDWSGGLDLMARMFSGRVDHIRRSRPSHLHIIHSWCEVDDRFIVDYHVSLDLAGDLSTCFQHLLILRDRSDLADKVLYFPWGRELSFCGYRIICLRQFARLRGKTIPLPYVTRLRL